VSRSSLRKSLTATGNPLSLRQEDRAVASANFVLGCAGGLSETAEPGVGENENTLVEVHRLQHLNFRPWWEVLSDTVSAWSSQVNYFKKGKNGLTG
jgi:hypothetical protein